MLTQPLVKHALISVSDKTGIVEFAKKLIRCGISIVATGGTAKLLQQHQIAITDISDYTGFPEIMDGRVKTLHPKIHGGLLGRPGIDDAVMQQHQIAAIGLVVVNLYPFSATIAKSDTTLAQAVEQIDIGGPTMLRAGAKNFDAVTCVVDPSDYDQVIQSLEQHAGSTTLDLRQQLALKVFQHTAHYDSIVSSYLAQQFKQNTTDTSFPQCYQPTFTQLSELRYGENPQQKAAFYRDQQTSEASLANATLLQGKALSYNNLIDADCALQCVQSLNPKQSGCVIIKHATPCGVAQGASPLDAYNKAYRCDPQSAFGGIVAFNQTPDEATITKILAQQFVEVLLAPKLNQATRQLLAKKTNLRVLVFGESTAKPQTQWALHSVSGGLLIQEQDTYCVQPEALKMVTQRQPTDNELQDLLFAWHVVKYIKSNAIVFAKDQATLGIGTGQTSRVFSAEIAALRAQSVNLSLQNAVLAGDAFFPFADGIEVAAKHGISAIIQPGGSKRDAEVIDAANAANIAMVFTGIRHFRH